MAFISGTFGHSVELHLVGEHIYAFYFSILHDQHHRLFHRLRQFSCMYDATGFYSHLWFGLLRYCCYCYLHFMEEIYHDKIVSQIP